jgi:DNA replication protein DnaC
MTINPLADWATRIAAHIGDPAEVEARGDALMEATDREAVESMRAQQIANRHSSYLRRRPTVYADASYECLTPAQNPRGMVSTWWEKGPRSLVLAGPGRTGKTTAGFAIANDLHARGVWVVASGAAMLSLAMKPGGDEYAFEHALACDLLLIDDLGRERVTDWWLEYLQMIIDQRCSNDRRLVVTMNCEPDAQRAYDTAAERYGTPVADRLVDDSGVLVFDGPAHRRLVSEW